MSRLLQKHTLVSETKTIVYCWIPGHVGIPGNEKADCHAKQALNLQISDFKVPYCDSKQSISNYIRQKWQHSWNNDVFNKLRIIKPTISESHNVSRVDRREEVVLTRLRLGHTRMTHSFLLSRGDKPKCIPCDTDFTVQHVLLDCIDLAPTRELFYSKTSMFDIFQTVDPTLILNFLKQGHP